MMRELSLLTERQMIEVRIPFQTIHKNHLEYIEQQLMAAGIPAYSLRILSRGMMKQWFDEPDFVFQWISYDEYYYRIEIVSFACKLCIALNGLKGTDIASLPKTEEELFEHIERVHKIPVCREGETEADTMKRFSEKNKS